MQTFQADSTAGYFSSKIEIHVNILINVAFCLMSVLIKVLVLNL